MPELPDVELYLAALETRIVERTLERARLRSPFLLRTVTPRLSDAEGRRVVGLRRLGKRIVWELDGELFLVFHLMITGRFRWRDRGAAIPGKYGLAAFDFPNGTLILTEMGSKKRASLHVAGGEGADGESRGQSLADHDPGGLEVVPSRWVDAPRSDGASPDDFAAALRRENHTLKRALTDPRILSGIGNAYSDEILHRAGMSPFKRTADLSDGELERLFVATRDVLGSWRQRLRAELGDAFPETVTAFRDGFAVHGRAGEPCPDCGSPVQRIVYADSETNYCAGCQTGGKLLADRMLSRLMKDDWPATLEELETLTHRHRSD